MLLASLLLQHASASSSVDLQPVSSTSSTMDLQPHSKWIRCIDDGRLDIRWFMVVASYTLAFSCHIKQRSARVQ
jgi:hypothetical protein